MARRTLRFYRAKAVAKRLVRLTGGLFGDAKSIGDGVWELRFDIGPGYRAYYTIKDRTIIIMLRGGNKSSQKRDIRKAKGDLADILSSN